MFLHTENFYCVRYFPMFEYFCPFTEYKFKCVDFYL